MSNDEELTGAQKESLQEALLRAYPTPANVKELFTTRLEQNFDAITGQGPLRVRILEAIEMAEAQGWTDTLVRKAYEKNPGNPYLKRFFATYDGSIQRELSRNKSSLEKLFNETGQITDFLPFRERLEKIERQVGRVEVDGSPRGTAFLIADDLVITNYHVIENQNVAAMSVRFDFKKLSDGTTINSGKVYKVAGNVVDQSPYSSIDLSYPRTGEAPESMLDYAVLRLDGKAGQEPIGSGKRELVKPFAGGAPSNGIMVIAQHPLGEPLGLAFGAILGVNGKGTRTTYTVDTQSGSSGSPCFDFKLNLIALHHGGDPRIRQRAEFNEGIPIDMIRRQLKPETRAALGWT